jgi:hypothetical protein
MAAESTADLWGLFINDAILDKIVLHSNQKIDEDILRANYSQEFLQKHAHIRHTDKVSYEEGLYLTKV